MIALLAASAAPVVVFVSLSALFLVAWGLGKYKDRQAERRSEELRNLYSSVHTDRVKR